MRWQESFKVHCLFLEFDVNLADRAGVGVPVGERRAGVVERHRLA